MSDAQASEIRAHFSGIRETIVQEIASANRTVTAAVAWLTDPEILEALLAAARRRVVVQIAILDDQNNSRSSASFERLKALGGRVCWIPASERRAGSLHHKFCVLDSEVVITGSFNWTKTASKADENIVVVKGDRAIVDGFEDAFRSLLKKYGHGAPAELLDTQKLLKRLNAISALLDLVDFEAIELQAGHLSAAQQIRGVPELLEALAAKRAEPARAYIREIHARLSAIIVYEDPDLVFLRMEVLSLEAELVGIAIEQAEVEQQIFEYDRQHSALVGSLVSEYLGLRAKLAEIVAAEQLANEAAQTAEAAAKAEYEKYQQALADAEPPATALTSDEQRELKKLWRVAAMRFHPDRVSPELQSIAAGLFHQAREAEKKGDLSAMRQLLAQYEKGPKLGERQRTDSAKVELEREIERLSREVAMVARKVSELRASKTFQIIGKLQDWGEHFENLRLQLETECDALRDKLGESKHG